jgi:hypothetical protein
VKRRRDLGLACTIAAAIAGCSGSAARDERPAVATDAPQPRGASGSEPLSHTVSAGEPSDQEPRSEPPAELVAYLSVLRNFFRAGFTVPAGMEFEGAPPRVVVRVTVMDGIVADYRIVSTSGHPDFDRIVAECFERRRGARLPDPPNPEIGADVEAHGIAFAMVP